MLFCSHLFVLPHSYKQRRGGKHNKNRSIMVLLISASLISLRLQDDRAAKTPANKQAKATQTTWLRFAHEYHEVKPTRPEAQHRSFFCYPEETVGWFECKSIFIGWELNIRTSTCVGNRSRASDTLWRAGRPFAFPASPFTRTPPPPPPPSASDKGESWPEASDSISLTQGGFRSTWKSAEILQFLETSKRARLMKKGSTWGWAKRFEIWQTTWLCCRFVLFKNLSFTILHLKT